MNGLDKYLLNEELNDQVFNGTYRFIKIHKEKFNDRFTILYVKDDSKHLKQNDYSIGGYLDMIDKTIYDANYELKNITPEDSIISIKSFADLHNEFKIGVKNYIKQYSFDNKDILKANSLEKYEEKNDWRFTNFQKSVRELFIREDNPTIKLDTFYSESDIDYLDNSNSKDICLEYLNNKEGTIKKYANLMIDKSKEELGLALHLYDDKIKYLERLNKNINNEFKDLYINKFIFESIKDEPAKTLNVTIKYNNKELTFKCDYPMLKRAIMNDDRGTSFYGVAYDRVNEFLNENKTNPERYRNDFEFSHISSIIYGKKTLYQNDNIKDKTKSEREER